MARPPITAKGELLFRKQLDAALDYVESLGGGSPAWGAITGTLSSQTDLQTALDAKASTATLSESIDDRVAALLTAVTTITLTYNGAAGTLTIDASGGVGGASPIMAWVI